uniref:Uncharacterized protein n=1 Tax=Cannabis sativa TaxID=3483 RepID=A0A803R9R2_CANSA
MDLNQGYSNKEISMSLKSRSSNHGMAPIPIPPRRLITISTGDGRWQGKWDSEFLVSLQDLRLTDLVETEDNDDHHRRPRHHKDALVSVKLKVEKVTSFSFISSCNMYICSLK